MQTKEVRGLLRQESSYGALFPSSIMMANHPSDGAHATRYDNVAVTEHDDAGGSSSNDDVTATSHDDIGDVDFASAGDVSSGPGTPLPAVCR